MHRAAIGLWDVVDLWDAEFGIVFIPPALLALPLSLLLIAVEGEMQTEPNASVGMFKGPS